MLTVTQYHRSSFKGEAMRVYAFIVLFYSTLYIIGDAGIIKAIATFYYIDIVTVLKLHKG